MAASDQLFQLVKSLNKTEKSYFKRNAHKRKQDQKSPYLELFDVMNNLEDYEESALLKQLNGHFTKRTLKPAKKYLYDLLLKTLAEYYRDKIRITDNIVYFIQCQILMDKGLYQQAYKLATKGYNQAMDEEVFPGACQFIHLFDEIAHQTGDMKAIEDVITEKLDLGCELLEREINFLKLRKLCVRFFYLIRNRYKQNDEASKQEIEAIINDPLMSDEANWKSFRAKNMAYFVMVKYSRTAGQFKESLRFRKAHLDLFDNHPENIKKWRLPYIRIFNNYMNGLVFTHNFDLFEKEHQRFMAIETTAQNQRIYQLRSCIFQRLDYLNESRQFNNRTDWLEDMEAIFAENREKFNPLDNCFIYFLLGRHYFGGGQYEKALDHINWVIDLKNEKVFADLQARARILYLLIHFEMNHFEHLKYAAESTSRYLKKQSRYFTSDKILIRFFGNLYKSVNPKPQKMHYQTMVNELEAIKDDEKEAEVFEYFDLLAWAKEKLANQ
ncbi:MAG: hypothetical protein AAF502_20540 [Bacteroidota bacterium]